MNLQEEEAMQKQLDAESVAATEKAYLSPDEVYMTGYFQAHYFSDGTRYSIRHYMEGFPLRKNIKTQK